MADFSILDLGEIILFMNRKLLIYGCLVVCFIFGVNALANSFYWYSAIWWFDIPMHILGGVFLALICGAIFFSKLSHLSTFKTIVTTLLFVLILGIGWEFFEYLVQAIIKGPQLANVGDSIKDVLMDIIGGNIGYIFVLRQIKRYNRAHVN